MNLQLRGRVVDGTGQPVADATVVVIDAPVPVPDVAAVSDEDGRFVFGGLSAGTYRLRATGPDGNVGGTSIVVPIEGVIRLGPVPSGKQMSDT